MYAVFKEKIMILYTSDIHFGHTNIIKLDHRPFADADTMDEFLIKSWNSRVNADDDVYVLGDVCYKSAKDPVWYLRQLKGHKHLITGNHDHYLLKDKNAMKHFETVDALTMIKDGDKDIILCHYPIVEWNGFFRGTWLVYGHIHNNTTNVAYQCMKNFDHALNAGCMINNYAPVSFNELVKNNREFQEKQNRDNQER